MVMVSPASSKAEAAIRAAESRRRNSSSTCPMLKPVGLAVLLTVVLATSAGQGDRLLAGVHRQGGLFGQWYPHHIQHMPLGGFGVGEREPDHVVGLQCWVDHGFGGEAVREAQAAGEDGRGGGVGLGLGVDER